MELALGVKQGEVEEKYGTCDVAGGKLKNILHHLLEDGDALMS